MMAQIYVKPRDGLKVRDPAHPKRAHIPAEGAFVPDGPYWRRRLRCKDVEKATPPTAAGERVGGAARAGRDKKEA